MKATDALDFEDLLLRGAELFRQEPWVLKSIKHIFVDEFQVSCSPDISPCPLQLTRLSRFKQDTNVTQYGLLKFVFLFLQLTSSPLLRSLISRTLFSPRLFAKSSGCVTIVGDPDQSIYGWRSAGELSCSFVFVASFLTRWTFSLHPSDRHRKSQPHGQRLPEDQGHSS